MDEEGYFHSNGQRLRDNELCRSLFESLSFHEHGSFLVNSAGTPAFLEAFDEPFVAAMVEKTDSTRWRLILPYGYTTEFEISSLCLDDWDRLHGRTIHHLPFVLSRKAQAEFFNLVDELEDDAIIVDGKRYPTPFWLNEHAESQSEKFWTEIYRTESSPPWDLGEPATALPTLLPQLKRPRSKILVLGCGKGHDAAFFAEQGHLVTAVDISEEALDWGRKHYGHLKDLKFENHDLFQLPEEWNHTFDLVFEHTCYCAISPLKRTDLVKVWRRMLTPQGHLLGVFFAMDKPNGPPFGGSEWEIRERLKGSFDFLYWTRWRHSRPRRQAKELIVYAQLKGS